MTPPSFHHLVDEYLRDPDRAPRTGVRPRNARIAVAGLRPLRRPSGANRCRSGGAGAARRHAGKAPPVPGSHHLTPWRRTAGSVTLGWRQGQKNGPWGVEHTLSGSCSCQEKSGGLVCKRRVTRAHRYGASRLALLLSDHAAGGANIRIRADSAMRGAEAVR